MPAPNLACLYRKHEGKLDPLYLDHLDVLDPELRALVEHRGQDDVAAVAVQDGARAAI